MVNILNKIFAKIRFLFILNACNNFFIIGTNVMEYYNTLSGAQAQYDLFDLKIFRKLNYPTYLRNIMIK